MKFLNVLNWSFLLSLGALVCADETQSDVDRDSTGRLCELLADISINIDDLEKQRYAFVAEGTRIRDMKDDFSTSQVYWIAAQEKPGKRLDAHCYTSNSVARPVLMERWQQRIVDGGKYYVRDTPYTDRPAREFEDKGKYEESKNGLFPMLPVQQSVAPALRLMSGGTPPATFDALIGDEVDLEKAEYTEDGDIVAVFDFSGQWSIQILFGKKSRFMPIETRHTSTRGKHEFLVSHCQTSWKQVGTLMLPEKMVTTHFHLSKQMTQFKLEFRWLVGDRLPKDSIVDVGLDDWREPIRVLFDQDWQRAGVRPPALATVELEE